jgi:3-deoxy-D-manno-octulosonic-acid transferase
MNWASLYQKAMRALEPFAGLILRRRVKAGKEDGNRLDERKGIASRPRPDGTLIWMHGASVGETTMLLPLINTLLDGDPKLHILVTSGTVTSADLLAERLPERAFHQVAPLDGPNFVEAFLSHWKPNLAIWAESEIWPNLISQTKKSGAKMALINARMSRKSLEGWTKKSNFARDIFSSFDFILAADENTGRALKEMDGEVLPKIGNLKAAGSVLEFDAAELRYLQKQIGRRPIWLAASTHGPEESDVLKAHLSGPAKKADALLIWVPRHPERGDDIAALCQGQPIAQRSKNETPTAETSIYIMDSLGEMGLALELADVAFIGGSLHKSLAGHNPLEPARARVPILTGPHVASFTQIYEELLNHHAAMRVTSPEHLAKSLVALMMDPGGAGQMARRAEQLAEDNNNILDYTAAQLRRLL